MIRDEAEALCRRLNERCGADLAEVEVLSKQAEFAAPGGGRPTFIRYKIRLVAGARTAHLSLEEAQELADLGEAPEGGWGPDRVFSLVAERGWEIEEPG